MDYGVLLSNFERDTARAARARAATNSNSAKKLARFPNRMRC